MPFTLMTPRAITTRLVFAGWTPMVGPSAWVARDSSLKAAHNDRGLPHDTPPNNGMHPTRFSMNVIVSLGGPKVVCGRVMPGVMPLSSPNLLPWELSSSPDGDSIGGSW